MADPLLEIAGLRVGFPTPAGVAWAADGVDLTIRAGKTLGLVGESGSGKSVTALSILRLNDDADTSGAICFRGRDLLRLPESDLVSIRGGTIAMIFQEPATCLNPVQTIGAQICEAIRLHRPISRRRAREEAIRLLSEAQFSDPVPSFRRYPHELSGGMKQRAMIAMALAGEPELLIADEPTTALDVTVQAEILRLLQRVQFERRLAILLITHDLGVVAEMADEVAVMYAGRIVEQAPVAELFDRPRHPYTIGLLGSLPRLEGDCVPIPMEGTVPLPTELPTGCRFRDRCASAFDRCGVDPRMHLLDSSNDHRVACWLHAQG